MRHLVLAFALILTACGGGDEEESGALNIEDRALANRIEDLAVLEKNEAEAAAPKPLLPIEPLSHDEIARELQPSAGCDLSVGDQMLLVAGTNDAIVKADGKIVHLERQGRPTPTGGYFTGGGLSISIGRASPDGEAGEKASSWPAEASIRHVSEEKPQTIKAIWRCGA